MKGRERDEGKRRDEGKKEEKYIKWEMMFVVFSDVRQHILDLTPRGHFLSVVGGCDVMALTDGPPLTRLRVFPRGPRSPLPCCPTPTHPVEIRAGHSWPTDSDIFPMTFDGEVPRK